MVPWGFLLGLKSVSNLITGFWSLACCKYYIHMYAHRLLKKKKNRIQQCHFCILNMRPHLWPCLFARWDVAENRKRFTVREESSVTRSELILLQQLAELLWCEGALVD